MTESAQTAFPALKQKVLSEPALQARLFEILDAHEFWLALDALAGELGLELDENTLASVMRERAQAWHGRQLP